MCTICQDQITNPLTASTCGHVFCSECLRPWVATNNTCPKCRVILPEGTAPQPEYFEFANEERERETAFTNGRAALMETQYLLARETAVVVADTLRDMDEFMMDLFEDMSTSPSPNARQVMRRVIRARDTITYEIVTSSSLLTGDQFNTMSVFETGAFFQIGDSIRTCARARNGHRKSMGQR